MTTKKTAAPSKKDKTPEIIYGSDGLPALPVGYEPSDNEEFMNPLMKEYFRQRLMNWKNDILRDSNETLHSLQEDGNMQKPDLTDRASEETDRAIEFRTRDRERKLLSKIDEALGRVEDGSYGYCEETGDPIPVKRLIAYPKATMTVEAQELHERRERTQRDTYE
jgi:DnaK suppressor protein